MLSYILIALFVAVLLICLAAARQPDIFSVTRAARINAAQDVVFAHVNNLRRWEGWSPWVRMDPGATALLDGPEEGVGAKVSWDGKKTGKGMMTITDSAPYTRVKYRLDFLKPMKATNDAEFVLAPDGDGTLVSWTMQGRNNFAGKVISLFMNCEKMVGGQFEQGLSNLRAVAEGRSAG